MSNTIIVQHNGVQQFTADNIAQAGNVYNFTDSAPPPPPQGRLTSAIVTWMVHDPFSQATDMTQYKNVAGVIALHQPPVDWPYIPGLQAKWTTPARYYTAFQINVPPAGTPMSTHYVKGASYSGSAPLKISISRTPGDFSATALKVLEDVTPENGKVIYFRNGPGTNFYVGLDPSGTYFINVVPMDNSRTQATGIATA